MPPGRDLPRQAAAAVRIMSVLRTGVQTHQRSCHPAARPLSPALPGAGLQIREECCIVIVKGQAGSGRHTAAMVVHLHLDMMGIFTATRRLLLITPTHPLTSPPPQPPSPQLQH
jgi:hypothetical protein